MKKIEVTNDVIERFWKNVSKQSDNECWEWVGSKRVDGYGDMGINNKKYLAHRISWVVHNEEIPEHDSWHGICVLHTCDNRACVNPSHLFLGTQKENIQDMNKKCREVRLPGEKNGSHKLTEAQVIEIREKYIPYKYSTCKLAREYGVHHSEIYRIVKYINWNYMCVSPALNEGELNE